MAETLAGRRVLLTTDAVGGAWTYSLDLARGFTAAGVEVVLAIMGPSPGSDMAETASAIDDMTVLDTGLPLDWLAKTPEEVLDAGRNLAQLARERECDTLQLHSPALAACGGFAVPVVSVHHSCVATWWAAVRGAKPLPQDVLWRSALVAQGMLESNAVVAPSTAHAHAVARAYQLAVPPLVIRNGRTAAKEEAAGCEQRAPFAFTSGRLWDEGKNAAAIDRAAARLHVPVMAAGAVQEPGGIPKTFPSLRLLGSLGQREMRDWLEQAPIYVSAARYEPFGLGVLEAAQAGCALVLSDIPSFRELWAGACLFVPLDEDGAIAEAINRLIAEPASLRRLSQRAQHRARFYGAEAMTQQMARLHAGLVAVHRIGRGEAA